MTDSDRSDRWVAVLGGRRERTGGERRRRHIFRRLAERTGADVVSGWSWESIRPAFGSGGLRIPWLDGARPRPRMVSGEMLDPAVLRRVLQHADPVAVAIYDDPIPHFSAVGVELPPERARALRTKRDANVSAFRWQVMPTLALAELAGIPLESVIAGENGTDTGQIVPGLWPEEPAIAVTSGAAPGRGIETLIDAARSLRDEVPGLRLLLWLLPTGTEGEAYVAALHQQFRRERWIQMDAVATGDLNFAYRQATLFCIPHPPHPYWDATLPVKIFDALAAGRPLVITPRTETQRLVERHGVGVASAGDTAEELADAMRPLLLDETEARRVGAVAREVAETVYDWTKVGDRIATAILEREGVLPAPKQLLA